MSQSLVAPDGKAMTLLPYPRPKRVVRAFNVYVKGAKTEVVTTRGERYTYLVVDGIDLYTDGLLVENTKYKVVVAKEPVAA